MWSDRRFAAGQNGLCRKQRLNPAGHLGRGRSGHNRKNANPHNKNPDGTVILAVEGMVVAKRDGKCRPLRRNMATGRTVLLGCMRNENVNPPVQPRRHIKKQTQKTQALSQHLTTPSGGRIILCKRRESASSFSCAAGSGNSKGRTAASQKDNAPECEATSRNNNGCMRTGAFMWRSRRIYCGIRSRRRFIWFSSFSC